MENEKIIKKYINFLSQEIYNNVCISIELEEKNIKIKELEEEIKKISKEKDKNIKEN